MAKERIANISFTPDNKKGQVDIQQGSVTDHEMVDMLNVLTKHFCTKIVNDAKEIVGNDPKELEKYLDWLRNNGLDKNQ